MASKTIFLHTGSADTQDFFAADPLDGTREATCLLRDRLASLGFSLQTATGRDTLAPDWALFYDAPSVHPFGGVRGPDRWLRSKLLGKRQPRRVFQEGVAAGLEDRIALFLWEPPSTTPENYSRRLHDLFPVVFTWHDDLAGTRNYHKMVYPQLSAWPDVPVVPFGDKKLLVNISANKISFHPRQLYSARRASIRHFERRRPDDFDLFGWGWDHLPMGVLRELWPRTVRHYPSYRGSVRRKWEVMPRYRFSLCYENIRDEPGYVTEKVFDSMRCGCVPIYWGASNIELYVTPHAFVDRRRFGSDLELEAYICGMTAVEYGRYLEAIRDFLAGETFRRFSPAAFVDTVTGTLGLEP